MSDQDLDEATSTYRILRIHSVRKEDVADGPSSLAWVWLVAGVAILFAVILGIVNRRPSDRG